MGADDDSSAALLFVSGSGSANNFIRVGNTLLANYNTGFDFSSLGNIKYGGGGIFIGHGTSAANSNAVAINNVPIDNIRLYVEAKAADSFGFVVGTFSGANALAVYTGSGGHTDPRVRIQNALVLPPIDPKPTSPEVGTIIVSGSSPARPYMWDGSTWYAM